MPRRQSDLEQRLGMKGAEYLSIKATEDALATQRGVLKKEIEKIFEEPTLLLETNGKHKEITVSLGGSVSIFFQRQVRESVSPVSNILDLVKEKLGADANRFIQRIETLTPGAIEQIYSEGLIDYSELQEWTTTKQTVALVVKEKEV